MPLIAEFHSKDTSNTKGIRVFVWEMVGRGQFDVYVENRQCSTGVDSFRTENLSAALEFAANEIRLNLSGC